MTLKKILLIIITLILTLFSHYVTAQSKVFDNPKNLTVLPEDISPADLSSVMRGFALGLGIRCTTCHVGEEGKPLSSYDFAADDKPMKEKARLMLQMVDQINQSFVPKLNQVDEKNEDRVMVRCVSCHRGQQKPLLIEDALNQALASGEPNAAINKYSELREKYYGSHTYNFGISVLPSFSDNLLRQGLKEDALALMELNQSYYPNSYYGNFVRAKALQQNKKNSAAIEAYKKALTINPRASFINGIIEQLGKEE
jgi:tetratricopeptide (TPR) repeat protein